MEFLFSRSTWVRWSRTLLAVAAINWTAHSLSQTADSFNPGANATAYSLALQSDGSLLAAGNFTVLAGSSRGQLGRFNPDGSKDGAFYPFSLANNPVYCLSVQSDGGMFVGGAFTNLTGVPRSHLARLTADGQLDITFTSGASADVHAIVVQADARILVAGAFTNLAGETRASLGRLESDGTLDATFAPLLDGPVYSLALQPDGAILLGGDFAHVNGVPRAGIARLDANGALDNGFNPGADGSVFCLVVQPDSQILAGGDFTTFAGQPRHGLARVAGDGLLDTDFDPSVTGEVRSLALQADGKIVVGGVFNTVGGQNRMNLARLDASGAADSFNPGANAKVLGLTLQQDGKLLAGGDFTTIAGVSRSRVARLTNDIATTQSLTFAGSTITWLRGGSSPEVWRAMFAASTNGVDWFDLPSPQRISGGWQLTGVNVPPGATIRARGEVSGGYNNGSTWFTESTVGPAAISVQPGDQVASYTAPARFSVTVAGDAPVSCQWYRNGAPIGGGTRTWYTGGPLIAGSTYEVVVSNALGTARSRVATLFVPGADSLNGGLASTVYALAPQPDGSIVVGGAISAVAQINPDGVLPQTLIASANSTINCLHTLPDGRILVGGSFTSLAATMRNRLARLNPGGELDATFNPNANGTVNTMVVQPDGKVLVGGEFTTLGGVSHPYLGRLNPDGTPDDTFNPAANGKVFALALQPDGKILVGGEFTSMNNTSRFRLAKLNASGSLDTTFNPGVTGTTVYCLLLQPDGKIVVGGNYTMLAGQPRLDLGRLNPDGSLDSAFNPGANGASIQSLILQADGRILVSGAFSMLGGQSRPGLGRLNPDGTLDTTFAPISAGTIYGLALQNDGRIVAGGSFTTLWGASRSRLGRLNNTTAATQTLTTDGNTVTWMRGGSCPEILRASFDYCTNGVDWIPLPTPERIAGGWHSVGATVPSNATLRARGQVTAGYLGGSGYFVEASRGPAAISIQPQSKPASLSEYLRLSVTLAGDGPFTYQWYRDGVALSGATNSWYIMQALVMNAYEVVAIGPGGTARSLPAYVWLFGTDRRFNSDADGAVYTIAIQPDQMILVGGAFTNSPGSHLARLDSTGNQDSSFSASAIGGSVYAVAVQPDGKILVGGSFTNLAGAARSGLGRLNADGSLDSSFNPAIAYGPVIHCLLVQPDGKILVGGRFTYLNGQDRYCLGRLNQDGSLDTGFVPPPGGGGFPGLGVTSMLLQPDGHIIVCGELWDDPVLQPNAFVDRLNADGSFSARLIHSDLSVHSIECAAQQADGGVLLGGSFLLRDGGFQLHQNLLRLDAFGLVDTNFTAWSDGTVSTLAVQADGKILVGGHFASLEGEYRNGLGRLNSDGTLDSTFDLEPAGAAWVRTMAIQPDGQVLVGGSFTSMASLKRINICRLTNLEIGTSSLQLTGSNVTWLRGNVAPEVEPAILESSTDGINWSFLGTGTRVAGGWQWSSASLPANALLRTRGFVGGNSSFWYVEDYLATSPLMPPLMLASGEGMGVTNGFGLYVSGSFGRLGVVEVSTNLVNWTPLGTNRIYAAPALFNDAAWTNQPMRFYRAYLQ